MVWKMKGIKMIYKKIGRITCDIDDKNIESLIRCLKAFKKYNFTEDVRVTESPSKKGWHVESWIKNWRNDEQAGVSLKKLLKIRKNAGDDSISEDTKLYWKENGKLKYSTIPKLHESFSKGNRIDVLTAKIKDKKCNNRKLRPLMTIPYTKIDWGEITDCWYRGKRETFRIELTGGKSIETTKNHSLFGRERWPSITNRLIPLTLEELKFVAAVEKEIKDGSLEDAYSLLFEAKLFTQFSDNLRKLYHMLIRRNETLNRRAIYQEFRKKYGNKIKPTRVTLGHYLAKLEQLGVISKKENNTSGWDTWEIKKDFNPAVNNGELYDLLVLCGLWLADGCYDRTKIHISTGGDKEIIKWIEVYLSNFKNIHKQNISVYISKFRRGDVIFSSYRLVKTMKYLGFNGKSENKKIPSFVFVLPNNYIAQLLKGYFSGDGCLSLSHKKPIIRLSSISKELLFGTKTLLSKLGINSAVASKKQKGGFGSKKIIYTLAIDQRNSVRKFLKTVGFIKKYDKKLYTISGGKKHDYDICLHKVKKIEPTGVKGVYDIEIKPTESFVANEILCHNSIRCDLDKYGDRAIQVLFTTKHKKIRGKKHDA